MVGISRDGQFARGVYQRIARGYDPLVWLFAPLGIRLGAYRRALVSSLALRPGHTVVDLGCGTGANLPLLARAVGPSGRVIGVDVSSRMLDKADARRQRTGARNIDLIEADFVEWDGPDQPVDAVCATLTLGMTARYREVVAQAAAWLRSSGRLGALEMQAPRGWPNWSLRAGIALMWMFGVRAEQLDRRACDAVLACLNTVVHRKYYGGVFCLAVGEATDKQENA